MMTNKTPQTPEVGMGATLRVGSDCYPHTIVEILSTKAIEIQRDHSVMAPEGNYFGDQVWNITSDPDGVTEVYTLRRNGKWHLKGQPMTNYGGLRIGNRRRYEDPHF